MSKTRGFDFLVLSTLLVCLLWFTCVERLIKFSAVYFLKVLGLLPLNSYRNNVLNLLSVYF